MMDCSTFKELNGLRPADLLPDEQDGLRNHLDECELCAREQRDDEELLALVDRWPRQDSSITAADIRAMDGLDTQLPRPGEIGERTERRFPMLQVALAIAATVAVALWLLPRLLAEPTAEPGITETQRLKSATDTTAPTAAVDLQFSVETPVAGTVQLQPGADDGTYGAEQGIIFGVQTDDMEGLTLVEQDPDGTALVLGADDGVRWARVDGGGSALLGPDGQHVTWRPDGASGIYRYTALVTEPPASSLSDSDIGALLRGEPVAGVELLASDSFAIEWTAGDPGVDVH